MRATSSSLKALPVNAIASNRRSRRKSAVVTAAFASTSATATRAPSRARKCAMVPPMFGPAPKTIATLPSRRFMSGRRFLHRRVVAPALQRHVLGVREPSPLLGGAAAAHRLQLAPEDLAQQRDAPIG